MKAAPEISLPRFSGPLDLLLALVRKNEVEITAIPIAEITRQYLGYLEQAAEMDIDLGAEFAYMAATLIHIKSRDLLPRLPAAMAGPDPKDELIRQLLDREQLQKAAEFLGQRLERNAASWSRAAGLEFEDWAPAPEPDAGPMNLLEVLRLAREALATAQAYQVVLPAETVTTAEMMEWLEARLRDSGGPIEAEALFGEQPGMEHRLALFLGMLELARGSIVRLEQTAAFGPLAVRATAKLMAHSCPNV